MQFASGARLRSRRSSFAPAATLAALALFFASTPAGADVSTAAAKLITGKQVKDRSLAGVDFRNRSLTRNDFKPGALPQGPPGDPGQPGAIGDRGATGSPGPHGASPVVAPHLFPDVP